MDKEKNDIYIRDILVVVTLVVMLAVVGIAFSRIQISQVRQGIEAEMRESVAYAQSAASQYEIKGKAVEEWDDISHEKNLVMLVRMMTEDPKLQTSKTYLSQMCSIANVRNIAVVNADGDVLCAATEVTEDLHDETYAPLLETIETGEMTKVEPVTKAEMFELVQDTTIPENESGETDPEALDEGPAPIFYDDPAPIFYAIKLDDKRACVLIDSGIEQLLSLDMTDPWELLLSNMVVGREGFIFAFTGETGEILYHPGYTGTNKAKNIQDLGLDTSKLKDCKFIEMNVNGQDLYLFGVYEEYDDVWMVCAVPMDEIVEGRRDVTILTWLLFGILAVGVAVYALSLMRRHMNIPGRRPHGPRGPGAKIGPKRRLVVFTSFCVIVFFVSTFFLQMLYLVSGWSNDNAKEADYIEYKVRDSESIFGVFKSYYTRSEQEVLDLATWYLQHYPERLTTDVLDELIVGLGMRSLRVYDINSVVSVADSSYAAKMVDTPAALVEDADASAESKSAGLVYDESTGASVLVLRSAYRADDDQIIGYVLSETAAPVLDIVEKELSLNGILETVRLGGGGFVFSVDSEAKTFAWHPETNLVGKSVFDYGLVEEDLKNNLSTYIVMEGVRYYATSGQSGNNLIYLVVPRESLMGGLFSLAVIETLVACAAFLLIGLWVYTIPHSKDRKPEILTRIKGHFESQTAEQLAFTALVAGLIVVSLAVLAATTLLGMKAREDVLGYVLNETWEYGVNEFAVTASAILVLEASFLLLLIRFVSRLVSQILSVRAATAIRMLTSLVSYVIVFSVIYRCLVFFGMDPSALMASAGIFSVVIGIGANSLVGDIIAGIFLLMEGNVQVGDVILIDGFRGRVEEIGIRMTKVYDFDACVFKIVPNKEVQNVVNMSMRSATIMTEFLISYDADLEQVEKLLLAELEAMEGDIPGMEGRPSYRGVERLDDNGVLLYVWAWGDEERHHIIKREINRRVYLMFNANGIEVPYPQVTVHKALSASPDEDDPVEVEGSDEDRDGARH